jgi:D-alanine-D-alanine ligase
MYNKTMQKKKIIVLCGGVSSEHEISLASGLEVEKNLDKEKYNVSRVIIQKDGSWEKVSVLGKKVSVKNKNGMDLLMKEKPDLVFIVMHGKNGEDGKIQALCDILNIPYTGSGVLASSLAMNKYATCNMVSGEILFADLLLVSRLDLKKNKKALFEKIKSTIGYPAVVKPNESGSSVGVFIVDGEKALANALTKSLKEDLFVLVQKYTKGREFTCGVLGNFNNPEDILAMPVVEIIPKSKFFDRKTKYDGTTSEICPAIIPQKLENQIKENAIKAHKMLLCDGLSRTDFIFNGKKLFFLETNTIPGATSESLAPKEAKAMGFTYAEFLDIQINLAFAKNI